MYVIGPGIVVLFLITLVVLPAINTRLSRAFSSIAVGLFRPILRENSRARQRIERLRAAHYSSTYLIYASRTLLVSIILGIAGGIAAVLGMWGYLTILDIHPLAVEEALPSGLSVLANVAILPQLAFTEALLLYIGSIATLGTLLGIGVYTARWYLPAYEASIRRRRIEAELPRTIAFMYALSRGGLSVPEIMEILATYQHVYGASAEEMGVAVRLMNDFGVDMITAISTMGRRSASPVFAEFAENLSSVLQSGRDVSGFLRDQYERHQEESEAYQEQLLTVLATTAEIWITALVAGPLFLLTILIVIGITIQDILTVIQLVVYAFIPLVNLAFMVYLGVLFDRLEGIETPSVSNQSIRDPDFYAIGARTLPSEAPVADGGAETTARDYAIMNRLEMYRRIERLRVWLRNPLRTIIEDPSRLLWVTIPLAVVATIARLPAVIVEGTVDFSRLDTILLQAGVFVLGTFAIGYELHRRRIDSIERSMPDFLDRLASVNEAGMALPAAIGHIQSSDLGRLDAELDVLWRDIQWGASIKTAFERFAHRLRTNMITRMSTLVVQSMRASGEVGSVLRIAAGQAKADQQLKTERRQQMATYVFIAYLSFAVFLVVLGAMHSVLLPSLPETGVDPGAIPTAPTTPLFSQLGTIDTAAYELVFYHAVLVQGLFSGLIAGFMSAGDIRNGAKHATVMLIIGWLVFGVLL